MASGLPVVVTDWDGYKETVPHGVAGFRVPTYAPQPGLGGDLAFRHAMNEHSYDLYCGHTSMLTAIDIDFAAARFVDLFESPQLRVRLGQAGKALVNERYDWSVIIPQYEELWASLRDMRNSVRDRKPEIWPARLDPFRAFSSYPTKMLSLECFVELPEDDDIFQAARKILDLKMVRYARYVLPRHEDVSIILTHLYDGRRSVASIIDLFPQSRQAHVFRGLLALMKVGIIRKCS